MTSSFAVFIVLRVPIISTGIWRWPVCMKGYYSHAVLLAQFDYMCKKFQLECYRRNMVVLALLSIHPVFFANYPVHGHR